MNECINYRSRKSTDRIIYSGGAHLVVERLPPSQAPQGRPLLLQGLQHQATAGLADLQKQQDLWRFEVAKVVLEAPHGRLLPLQGLQHQARLDSAGLQKQQDLGRLEVAKVVVDPSTSHIHNSCPY